jgi:hypothetical protein
MPAIAVKIVEHVVVLAVERCVATGVPRPDALFPEIPTT